MSLRNGRSVVGFEESSQTLPRSYGSQCHAFYQHRTPNHQAPLRFHTEFLSPGPPCDIKCSPQGAGISYHPPNVSSHHPFNSSPVCDICQTIEEYPLQQCTPRQGHIPVGHRGIETKAEWCSDCDKHNLGPPCKCAIPDCENEEISDEMGLSYNEWVSPHAHQHFKGFYPLKSFVPVRQIHHQLPRTSSDCMVSIISFYYTC